MACSNYGVYVTRNGEQEQDRMSKAMSNLED